MINIQERNPGDDLLCKLSLQTNKQSLCTASILKETSQGTIIRISFLNTFRHEIDFEPLKWANYKRFKNSYHKSSTDFM